MIFSHVLYQLSYLGIWRGFGGRPWCDAPEAIDLDRVSGRGALIGNVARTVQPYAPNGYGGGSRGAARNLRAAGAIAG